MGIWSVSGEPVTLRPEQASGDMLAGTKEDPATIDDWRCCEIEKPEDSKALFVPNFYFGRGISSTVYRVYCVY